MGPVLQILEALDINSRRLVHRFDTGPPLKERPVILDPAWLAWEGGTVPRLARAIAEEGAFDRLPILGDALEEAGCADAAILEHSLSAGRHTRRSWVVDLILRGWC